MVMRFFTKVYRNTKTEAKRIFFKMIQQWRLVKQTVEKKRWAGRPEGIPKVQLKKKEAPNPLTTRSTGERTGSRRQTEAFKSRGVPRHFLNIIPDQ